MYGKDTRFRFAQEASWGMVPSGGWVGAAAAGSKVSLSERLPALRRVTGTAGGIAHAIASFEVAPAAANLAALSAAALSRDEYGQMQSYTVEAADSSGAWRVPGAVVRRFKARSGIARPRLEFLFEAVGKDWASAAAFDPSGGGKPFVFAGSTAKVGNVPVDAAEFSVNVNNNVFMGPAADDESTGFVTAGRQEVTGYVIVREDRRDFIDGDEHSIEIALAAAPSKAVITVAAAFFTWCREIRSASAGALQVLYFESASGAITGGVSIALL